MIGLGFVNLGSRQLHSGDYALAIESYTKAKLFLPGDLLVDELLGYALLFNGEKERAAEQLRALKAAAQSSDGEEIPMEKMVEDYLTGRVDEEGIKMIFLLEEGDRKEVLEKMKQLSLVLEKFPLFRDGIYQMAALHHQLHHVKEALSYLERYHAIDPNNLVIEATLAELYLERRDFPKAWSHLEIAERLVKEKKGYDKPLVQLRRTLSLLSPR